MLDLAELLAAEARDLGRMVEVRRTGIPALDDALNIIVAPHEYFHFEADVPPDRRSEILRSCAVLTTEQPGTQWFELAASAALGCRAAFDLHAAGAAALRDLGIPADHLKIGYTPHWDRWQCLTGSRRDLDVLFLGATTPYRHAVLATMADVLSAVRSELLLFESDQPVASADPNFLSGERLWAKLACSRALLNIRRAPGTGYFEWARCLPAVLNGALVVTEPSEGTAPLVAFDHFISASPALLGAHLLALLDNEPARTRMTVDAYDRLRSVAPLREAVRDLLAWADDQVPVHKGRVREGANEEREALSARASAALAVAPLLARTQGPQSAEGHAVMLGAAKRLLLESLRLRRTIERFSSPQREPSDVVEIASTSSLGEVEPDVSVVIPTYNHAAFVADAVTSALGSEGVTVEVVVIDDGSTDATPKVLAELLGRFSHRSIKVVRFAVNQGLPTARNAGFIHASAPLVFPLDADNSLLPFGLRRLKEGIGDDAFCYGILAAFGDSRRLVSHLPWDVGRLCKGNYIDGMALIRRSTWELVGGYTSGPDDVLYGWEDYAFWLACASRGLSGTLVPQLVGRYRVREGSMISITNVETDSAFAYLRHTHPRLPWQANQR
jgi:hypothetical protein